MSPVLAHSGHSLRRNSLSAFGQQRTLVGFGRGTVCPIMTQNDMSEPFCCDAHEGSHSTAMLLFGESHAAGTPSTAMLLFGESHAAGTPSLPSAGTLRALQSARDGIAVCRTHGNIPRRQSRRIDDASGENLHRAVRLDFPIQRIPPRLTLVAFLAAENATFDISINQKGKTPGSLRRWA